MVAGVKNNLSWSTLPNELLFMAFSHLTEIPDCVRASTVCRNWNAVIKTGRDLVMEYRLQRLSRVVTEALVFQPKGFSYHEFSRVNPSGSFVGIDSRSYERGSLVEEGTVVHRVEGLLTPLSNQKEKCIGHNGSFSFFFSLEERDRLVIRNNKTFEKVAECGLKSSIPQMRREDIACDLLAAFPLPNSETDFVTVSRGVVVQWKLHAQRLEMQKVLRIFTKKCTDQRTIVRAHAVENILVCEAVGTVPGIFADKIRKHSVVFGMDLQRNKLIDFRHSLPSFSATADRLYTRQGLKLKAYSLPENYAESDVLLGELKQKWTFITSSYLAPEKNDQWCVIGNREENHVRYSLLRSGNGRHFFSFITKPKDVHDHYLRGNLLFVRREYKVDIYYIPTKQRVQLPLDLRTFFPQSPYTKIEDIIVTPQEILFLCLTRSGSPDRPSICRILRVSFDAQRPVKLVPIETANLSAPVPPPAQAPVPVAPAQPSRPPRWFVIMWMMFLAVGLVSLLVEGVKKLSHLVKRLSS